jgi:ABC-type phosphate/phosphonate transport system permease subunit
MAEKTRKKRKDNLYQRYALTGAAIGIYFGIFYRPTRAPSFTNAILLALVAAVVTLVVRSWKKRPLRLLPVLYDFLKLFFSFSIFLLALEFRHIAEDFGGRLAVTLVTTLTGIGLGLLMAFDELRQRNDQALASQPPKTP